MWVVGCGVWGVGCVGYGVWDVATMNRSLGPASGSGLGLSLLVLGTGAGAGSEVWSVNFLVSHLYCA